MQVFMVLGVPYAELETAKKAALEHYSTHHETQWHTRTWSGGILHEMWVNIPLDECPLELKRDLRKLTDRLGTLLGDHVWLQPSAMVSVFETTLL